MDKLRFIMSEMWAFLWPFIKILLTQSGKLLAQLAMQAVATMASSEMSGPEKREAAVALVKDGLKTQGVVLATSVINAAIEAAVLKLKEV